MSLSLVGTFFPALSMIRFINTTRRAHEFVSKIRPLPLPKKAHIFPLYDFRTICVDEGQELSLAYGCQFYEVSAAENFAGVSLAFQTLLREARSVQMLKALPIRRKLGVNSVSKVLGTLFGKNYNKTAGNQGDKRKKRPSLSI